MVSDTQSTFTQLQPIRSLFVSIGSENIPVSGEISLRSHNKYIYDVAVTGVKFTCGSDDVV